MRLPVYDVIRSRRSIRSFDARPIPRESIQRMLEAGRLAPNRSNNQPLRFWAVCSPALCRAIFPQTRWAARLPDGQGKPAPGHEPTAYILLLVDQQLCADGAKIDVGAAGASILLQARSEGIGSCWLGAINRDGIAQTLGIDQDKLAIDSIIALGYPDMEPVARDMAPEETDVAYYIDDNGTFTVPKRAPEITERIIG